MNQDDKAQKAMAVQKGQTKGDPVQKVLEAYEPYRTALREELGMEAEAEMSRRAAADPMPRRKLPDVVQVERMIQNKHFEPRQLTRLMAALLATSGQDIGQIADYLDDSKRLMKGTKRL